MEFALLGWPADGPTLDLDHTAFSYAGKFVMSNTGKAVATEGGDVVAAVSFSEDRTDADVAWLRYVTVRRDRRGEGIGPRLAAFATARLHDRGYAAVRIAVNNPFAYEALYRAGFEFTGERTGIAELVLARPASPEQRREPERDRDPAGYSEGLAAFRERDGLSEAERAFLDDRDGTDPPAVVTTDT